MHPFLEALLVVGLYVSMVVALVSQVLSLPGNWIILLLVGGYGWLTDFESFGVGSFVALVALAGVGEGVELAAGAAGARRFGGSRAGAWGALVGALVGGIVGTPFLFGIGALFGSVAGAFVGAVVVELARRDAAEDAVRAGVGSAIGKAAGIGFKIGCGCAMIALVTVQLLR